MVTSRYRIEANWIEEGNLRALYDDCIHVEEFPLEPLCDTFSSVVDQFVDWNQDWLKPLEEQGVTVVLRGYDDNGGIIGVTTLFDIN